MMTPGVSWHVCKTGFGNNILLQQIFLKELENYKRKGINFLIFQNPKIFGALAN